MKKRKLIAIIATLLTLTLIFGLSSMVFAAGESELTAFTADGDGGKRAQEGALVLAGPEEPATLEPNDAQVITGWVVTSALYDTLIELDSETKTYVGVLAEQCEFTDDTTLLIKVKEGIQFHNGAPLTADDVLFTLERLAACPRYSTNYVCIDFENTKLIDDFTLEVKLNTPYPALLAYLGHPSAGILCRSYYEEAGEEGLARKPIGTGAFVFENWVSGSEVTATRNENYWNTEVPFNYDKLVVKFIPEANTRMAEFESNGIDILIDVGNSDIKRMMNLEVEGSTLYRTEGECIYRICFLGTDENMQNPLVRQAIISAIDLPGTVAAAYGETAQFFTSLVPADCNYYKEMPAYTYDPEAAKELLKEAGYENGLALKTYVAAGSNDAKAGEIIQQMLAEVGISLELESTDVMTMIMAEVNGEVPIGLINNTVDSKDPDQGLSNLKAESPFKMGATSDEALAQMLNEAAVTVDFEERGALYEAIQDYVYENVCTVPYAVNIVNYAAKNYIDSCPVSPSGRVDVRYVTFK